MSQPESGPGHHGVEGAVAVPLPSGSLAAEMVHHIEQHVEDEREMLVAYGTLLRQSDNPAVRYLLDLLLDDEKRHHSILLDMLDQFRSGDTVAEQPPRVPWMTRKPDPEIAAATKRLRQAERTDLRKLRGLRRKFSQRRSLNGVLVDSLMLDTRKHIRYLRAIQRLV
jgi:hypothetical protein